MLSRMEASLNAEISATASESDRLHLIARRAGMKARLGQLDAARSDVKTVRDQQRGYQSLLIGRLQVAEAEIEHYSGASRLAMDHARRAYAIAVGTGDTSLHASSAAWMAAVEFIGGNVHAAISFAKECLDRRNDAEPSSLGRAMLVLADSWAHAGEQIRARDWYSATRSVATSNGDLGLQSACLYNSTAFALAALVDADCFGGGVALDSSAVRMQIESIRTLDTLISNRALESYGPMLEAELLVVEKRWDDAARVLLALTESSSSFPSRLAAKYLASQSLCAMNLREIELSLKLAEAAEQALVNCIDLDDRAVTEARLAQALDHVPNNSDRATGHRGSAERCRTQYREQRQALLPLLRPLLPPLEYAGH